MKHIKIYLENLTMYRAVLYFLYFLVIVTVVYSFFSQSPYSALSLLIQAVLFVGLCWFINRILSRLVKTDPNHESSLITGMILFLIMGPLSLPMDWREGWAVLFVASLAAMVSKYLIVKNKSHIFNPAAFGAAASALILNYPATWWVGGQEILPFLIIGGILLVYKIRRLHLVISFLLSYGLLTLFDSIVAGTNIITAVISLKSLLLLSSSLVFFMFIMLVEPLTSPRTTMRRVYFGIFVAVTLFFLQKFAGSVSFSLELALLIGNIFARIINPDLRQTMILRIKENLAPSITSFWFTPTSPINFEPGQFLEYTLSHPKPDNRGTRRYFTIASSPTEKEILITTRFAEKGSTFKNALSRMTPGDKIIASKVAGEFVLPKNIGDKIVFIAGGIGITPYRSMVKYILDKEEKRDIILIYASKIESDLVFRDIFEIAHNQFGLKNVYVLSDEANLPAGWSGQKGYVSAELIKEEVTDFEERIFYVSGPEPMVQSIEKVLEGMGISKSKIIHDYFPGY